MGEVAFGGRLILPFRGLCIRSAGPGIVPREKVDISSRFETVCYTETKDFSL